jgi:hypothetical protein
MHRRILVSRPAQPACRRVLRRVRRHALRRVPRRAPRRVLKDDGPSLHELCNVVSAYLRLSQAWDRKWNPPSRFKTIGIPEEHRRQMDADLARAYGENSPFPRTQAAQPPAAPPPPPTPAPPSAPEPARPEPPPRCDVVAIPLVRLPNGLLSLDWSRAYPAP